VWYRSSRGQSDCGFDFGGRHAESQTVVLGNASRVVFRVGLHIIGSIAAHYDTQTHEEYDRDNCFDPHATSST
jgi:hypothetical protein